MVRVVTLVALAVVLAAGPSCRKAPRERHPPPVRIVPEPCNGTEPRIRLENLRRRETGKPPRLWEYLLDVRVRMGGNERRWLVVDQAYFPEHVYEVSREDALPGDWRAGWREELTADERLPADPQVDWTFRGDEHHVTARWLARGGDLLVRNVRAYTTQDERRISVALMEITVDDMFATDWVAAGGPGYHRSLREEEAVSASTHVYCVDWLELDPPDGEPDR
jgi:hypothetical protein